MTKHQPLTREERLLRALHSLTRDTRTPVAEAPRVDSPDRRDSATQTTDEQERGSPVRVRLPRL